VVVEVVGGEVVRSESTAVVVVTRAVVVEVVGRGSTAVVVVTRAVVVTGVEGEVEGGDGRDAAVVLTVIGRRRAR
jgi:hypothetical protein